MYYFTTRTVALFPSYALKEKYVKELDDFLSFLDRSGVERYLDFRVRSNKGRPGYDRYALFATILFGFTFDRGSLRDIAKRCEYDMRYIYLMQGDVPSYRTIGYFINDYILPKRDDIFGCLVSQILSDLKITIDEIFIDGTKIEADANKYKFVWKPTKWHINLCNKVRNFLKIISLDDNIPSDDIFPSFIIAKKITEYMGIMDNNSKIDNKRLNSLKEYLDKALEYEEKEAICGPDRNSYYKTDHDATAMVLKEDYYSGLGSNMHAAYNLQIAVARGIVIQRFLSQNRNDIKELMPLLDKVHHAYGQYPKAVSGDSGYGSYENYLYLEAHGIKSYVKHQSWQGNVSGRNPSQYTINDDDTITCLNGITGHNIDIKNRHPKYADSVFYRIDGCNDCPFKDFCKRFMKDKTEDYKIFEVNVKYAHLKRQSEINLLSPKGIELRVNRSAQVEGVFGSLKYDMEYDRLRRTGMERVDTEITLTLLGHNLRKLFKHFRGISESKYWVAPEGLESETFKKPRANILSRKARKVKEKSVNQRAKDSYKYRRKKRCDKSRLT